MSANKVQGKMSSHILKKSPIALTYKQKWKKQIVKCLPLQHVWPWVGNGLKRCGVCGSASQWFELVKILLYVLLHLLVLAWNTFSSTVEPFLKDHPIVHIIWSLKTGDLLPFCDRFICSAIWDFLPRICGLSRQVVCHGSGLSRHVSLYSPIT